MWLASIPKTLDTQSTQGSLTQKYSFKTTGVTKYMETEKLSEKEEELLPIKRAREVS